MKQRTSNSGFSLIELMIAMTIGLIILAVLGTVFSNTSSGRGDLERVSRLVENARFAAEIIGEDVRHAGFYGNFMPASDVEFDDAGPCNWNTTDVTTLGWRHNDTPPRYPAPMQAWDDPGSVAALDDCLPNRLLGTDVLAIRRVSSTTVTRAQIDAGVPAVYVQASQCVSDPVPPVRVSHDSAAFVLKTAACGAALAGIRRYFVRIYYVAACNDCAGGGDGVPTLKRVERVNNSWQVTSLAEGVENLQFEYAFDTNNDGVPEEMRTMTGSAGPTVSWANVVGVRMHALMRSSEAGLSANTTPTVFDLGPNHANVTCPDRFRCRLLTSTFRLNNVAGRRES